MRKGKKERERERERERECFASLETPRRRINIISWNPDVAQTRRFSLFQTLSTCGVFLSFFVFFLFSFFFGHSYTCVCAYCVFRN